MPAPDQLLHLLTERGGLLTARAVHDAGLPSMALTRLLDRGLIERVQRGVYRLVDDAGLPEVDLTAQDLLEVQLRAKFARPCLISALHLHGLSTTRPPRLQFAVPTRRHAPHITTPRTEFFYFGPHAYSAGLMTVDVRGQALTLYTPEKTLADLLRYVPKLGRELYLEGLKKYLRQRDRRLPLLQETAQSAGVGKGLNRDLGVLLHDQDH